jgi:hypothetical protein
MHGRPLRIEAVSGHPETVPSSAHDVIAGSAHLPSMPAKLSTLLLAAIHAAPLREQSAEGGLAFSDRPRQRAEQPRRALHRARKLAEVSASDDGSNEQRGPGEPQAFIVG